MQFTIVKAVILSSLWASLSAMATPVSTVYPGTTAVDTYAFTLVDGSSVAINYSWSDMLLTKVGDQRYYDAFSLGWTLTGTSSASGSLVDAPTLNAVSSGLLNLGNLGPGSYLLSLVGTWSNVTIPGNGNTGFINTAGTVDLLDGDLIGNQRQVNSFQATPIVTEITSLAAPAAQIPEPQGLVMVLSGLGLLAAYRRRSVSTKS